MQLSSNPAVCQFDFLEGGLKTRKLVKTDFYANTGAMWASSPECAIIYLLRHSLSPVNPLSPPIFEKSLSLSSAIRQLGTSADVETAAGPQRPRPRIRLTSSTRRARKSPLPKGPCRRELGCSCFTRLEAAPASPHGNSSPRLEP